MYKMLNKLKLSIVFGALLMAQVACATDMDGAVDKALEPFPAAKSDQVRHVIVLPELADENDAKVELVIGKEIDADCNHYFFGGNLQEVDLQGWGYTYWVLDDLKGPAGTLMACLDNKKTPTFVQLNTEELLRYNSKLPIVVYTPEGVQVRYRVWQVGHGDQVAEVR